MKDYFLDKKIEHTKRMINLLIDKNKKKLRYFKKDASVNRLILKDISDCKKVIANIHNYNYLIQIMNNSTCHGLKFNLSDLVKYYEKRNR